MYWKLGNEIININAVNSFKIEDGEFYEYAVFSGLGFNSKYELEFTNNMFRNSKDTDEDYDGDRFSWYNEFLLTAFMFSKEPDVRGSGEVRMPKLCNFDKKLSIEGVVKGLSLSQEDIDKITEKICIIVDSRIGDICYFTKTIKISDNKELNTISLSVEKIFDNKEPVYNLKILDGISHEEIYKGSFTGSTKLIIDKVLGAYIREVRNYTFLNVENKVRPNPKFEEDEQ